MRKPLSARCPHSLEDIHNDAWFMSITEMLRPELTGIAVLGCVDLLLGLWRFRRQFC
jgi:hypothetical protein